MTGQGADRNSVRAERDQGAHRHVALVTRAPVDNDEPPGDGCFGIQRRIHRIPDFIQANPDRRIFVRGNIEDEHSVALRMEGGKW